AGIAERFDLAWRQGGRPRIESFLEQSLEPFAPELFRDLLGIELEVRRKSGDAPHPEEYLDRFPHFRALIDDAFPARPADPSTMPKVDGYKITRLLGAGGFSEVWLAEDLNVFHREVALKMIKPRTTPKRRQSSLESLRHEARILVTVRHPNLVSVFDWVE